MCVYIMHIYIQLFFLPGRFPFRSGTPSRSHSPIYKYIYIRTYVNT